MMSAEDIVAQMAYLKEHFDPDYILIGDSNFNVSTERTKKFIGIMKEDNRANVLRHPSEATHKFGRIYYDNLETLRYSRTQMGGCRVLKKHRQFTLMRTTHVLAKAVQEHAAK